MEVDSYAECARDIRRGRIQHQTCKRPVWCPLHSLQLDCNVNYVVTESGRFGRARQYIRISNVHA
jgi:hypothetical protein